MFALSTAGGLDAQPLANPTPARRRTKSNDALRNMRVTVALPLAKCARTVFATFPPMRTSVLWINDYLLPTADASEQAKVLTALGLPLDGEGTAENGEAWQEIETTSNRGDCLSHVGMAREIAASTGRTLKLPSHALPTLTNAAACPIKVTNAEHAFCPRYTARVITGVKVGPSPEWLQRRLIAIGQVPRNNIVDATNFVLFELGQPTHVFDMATLAGAEIRIRRATAGEKFLPLGADAKAITLTSDDFVIADAAQPIALAGIKGGALASVTATTTDIVLEAATFDPARVRASSRRHGISSDSSYRFERTVHPADIDLAAARLAALILEIAGGTLVGAVADVGAVIPASLRVSLRPARCRALLGTAVSDARMVELLNKLDFQPSLRADGSAIDCLVPPRRVDVTREVDLIEEICRLAGIESIPVTDTIAVRLPAPSPIERGTRAVKATLASLGFVETITHSLVSDKAAAVFLPQGASALRVDDATAGEPALRTSVLSSLMHVKSHNQSNGTPSLALFEIASAFHWEGKSHRERPTLAMLSDACDGSRDAQSAYRFIRASVERALRVVAGRACAIEFQPLTADCPTWLLAGARVVVDGVSVGVAGVVAAALQKTHGLDRPVACAELTLRGLLLNFPPESSATELPAFPATDRDVSAIVAESVAWGAIEQSILASTLADLESVQFVGVFRGKQIGEGKKSVTARLRFRRTDGTLRAEDVEPRIASMLERLKHETNAEIRSV